ncbi:hypothetical protein [Streptomyces sp. NBC_01443]|uniref:PGAP1-like alpha/beta domain-containing protein n=1 Tax=Streptomyces sp. NBC_01443 TaxID=2903868 RepID=UPI002257CAA4|nr:hypothetical protein [Streptomyces sp. NBC_01443]MCX4632871.1 GPI inositol-deacylase [Streptomyces sp. NBC_01443]
MATFVGIHGIGQQLSGGKYTLSEEWQNALRGGLSEAGHDAEAEQVQPEDVRVMYFGGLFRLRTGGMAVDDPPYTPADIQAGPEMDLLETLYEAAVKQDPSLGPGEGAMFPGAVPVQVMLARLLRIPLFSGIAQRAFIGNLKQVTRYLADESLREQVLERVHDGIGDDTRVLIGHSLGSVVAYEYMCQFRPASVRMLLTLGSPLGIPNLVFDRLTPRPEEGKGAWAGSVPVWVNVAALNDIVAMRKELAGLFPGPDSETVDDRQVENGFLLHAHSIVRYLSAPQTGSALHDAIG